MIVFCHNFVLFTAFKKLETVAQKIGRFFMLFYTKSIFFGSRAKTPLEDWQRLGYYSKSRL